MDKPSRPWLIALLFAAVLVALPSHRARATGPVLTPSGALTTLDLELAVAVTPFGSARWARITVEGAPRVLWLVPARPGATLDWATSAWLDALEDTSAPRVTTPDDSPPCSMPTNTDPAAAWAAVGRQVTAHAPPIFSVESELRGYIAAQGFTVPKSADAKIAEAFAAGEALVAVDLETNNKRVTGPTLRITDDGASTLPLALTGSDDVMVRVTALVIAPTGASLPGTQPLENIPLSWGPAGSSFASARDATLEGGSGSVWLRESASRDALFGDVDVPHGTKISSLVRQYFVASPASSASCIDGAQAAGKSGTMLGRACPAGALGRVAGGTSTCTPTDDVAAFTCGDGYDDLAIALSGTAPSSATLTRFTGLVPQSASGSDLPIGTASASESPVKHATSYQPCPATPPPAATGVPTTETIDRPHHYRRDESGCSGNTTTLIFEDTGEEDVVDSDTGGCDGTHTIAPKSTSETIEVDDNGGGSSSSSSSTGGSSSSSSAAGWDSTDSSSDSCGSSSSSSDSCGCGSSDSSSSSDSCGSDSSSSSDSCGGGSGGGDSCSGGGGGGDCGNCDIAGRGDRERLFSRSLPKKARGRAGSPISRYSLFLIALALPLRRRTRPRTAV